MSKKTKRTDPALVTIRAKEIADADLVQYWIVVSAGELTRLLDGDVAPNVRTQAVAHLHREKNESADAFMARLEEIVA